MDSAIFEGARGVVEALGRHDCGPALAWCAANEPRLRKLRSSLEFQLRVQVRTSGASNYNLNRYVARI